MDAIRFTVDADRAMAAFGRAPEVMRRAVDGGLEEAAQVVARAARERAPKFHSTLTNSIRAERVTEGLRPDVLAWQARTGKNYARYVEEGIRPMQDRPPGIENGLLEWVRAKFKPGNDKELSRIAFAVGFAIQRRGIKPRPYMAPAMQASEARVRQILRNAVHAGVVEVFGAG